MEGYEMEGENMSGRPAGLDAVVHLGQKHNGTKKGPKKKRKKPELIVVDGPVDENSSTFVDKAVQGQTFSLEEARRMGILDNPVPAPTPEPAPEPEPVPTEPVAEVSIPTPEEANDLMKQYENVNVVDPKLALELFVLALKEAKQSGVSFKLVDQNRNEIKGLDIIVEEPEKSGYTW